ncbi:glycoside hydrolase family 92 protein [Vararia minispora EC-137]|uniref:Glycoside hydrolase family 92 protein n=1 Tax=Vararia minispora EC-137 TaxID=1314806 RepID=A0ACB8QPI7_9AGAM|nr:glycoside hydrolase family 92 protein [Vararia minispora EC-137]
MALVLALATTFISILQSPFLWQSVPDPLLGIQNEGPSASSFVNLFIGTANNGHVFPGATLPHGMVKVGMDTNSRNNQAGYDADPKYSVTGFSQLHDDGTGDRASLSNFKIFPTAGCPAFELCETSVFKRPVLRAILPDGTPDDLGKPGYFSTNLSTGVRAELTATRRASLQRYTFQPDVDGSLPRINVDITNDGQRSGNSPTLSIDPLTGRVTGGAVFQASFGPRQYKAYTCVDFRLVSSSDPLLLRAPPAEYGTWSRNGPVLNEVGNNLRKCAVRIASSRTQMFLLVSYGEVGALLGFQPPNTTAPTTILVRSGVSFISEKQACDNADSEIPDFGFDRVAREAQKEWDELLGRIRVTLGEGQEDTRELLYSSLYRTHISPADYSEENPLWNSTEPYYDSFYCNWDTYRTMFPLLAMHDPERFALIVRGMISIQQHEGWLPECRGATSLQYIQGGSDGEPIVAEFYVKFFEYAASMNVSSEKMYEALLADAENEPKNADLQGRLATMWKEYSYIPKDGHTPGGSLAPRSVSRALEYAFSDFTISQVAKLLNRTEDAVKYAGRAGNFVNHWNPETTMPDGPSSVRGMMQPRLKNGSFSYTDPRHCSPHAPPRSGTCYFSAGDLTGFYEGSPLLYSQYAPHDTAKLIELQGGPTTFIERLDFIIDNDYFDVTDEPGQQVPFMYHYADRPGLSTNRTRQTLELFFNTTVAGLPGNDGTVEHSGAMGSYAFFVLAGLYPLPATRQLLLSSPYFPSISFFNPLFNAKATIKVTNFEGANSTKIFVQDVLVDGQPWHSRCFIEWDVFERGSTVEITLTDDITLPCGDSPNALPPSLSTGGYD